jgi:hypothetical protein
MTRSSHLGASWGDIHPDSREWDDPGTTEKILGGVPGSVQTSWGRICATRLRNLRDELRQSWDGLCLPRQGHLTDWLLATLLARENALLIGPPGCAKSEIATRTFQLLGLDTPEVDEEVLRHCLSMGTLASPHPPAPSPTEGRGGERAPHPPAPSPRQWWREREKLEQNTHKYFHYLLSRFTQPEELFGPVEISLLRQGILARVNFGLLTGPGVRAAFLDEIFKASSSILNTLLTLTNERLYFNWGGLEPSDLVMFIGASNEMPGGFSSGTAGVGAYGEDFQTLHAFLDRFPVRLPVPIVSATSDPSGDVLHSDMHNALHKALRREGNRFCAGVAFVEPAQAMPGINDALFLGRFTYQHLCGHGEDPFAAQERVRFLEAFERIAAALQQEPTSTADRRVTWTISPRKLKALYKIGLAHALVRDDRYTREGDTVRLGAEDLQVFSLIWDTPVERTGLEDRVESLIKRYGK